MGGHLLYREPSPNNDHSGARGGGFLWTQFCSLSIEELGEAQQKGYYKSKADGTLRDKDGVRVKYDDNTGKLATIK
jgi:hypothetical protein